MNLVVLTGNLCENPELRYSGTGKGVCNMRLAVNGRRAKEGEQDEVVFIDATAFGKTAEACKEHLSKGSRINVQGRLRQRKWEKDGQPHSKIEVLVDRIDFLSGKKGAGADAPGEAGTEAQAESGETGDEELPY